MPTLVIPAFTWTFSGTNYPLSQRTITTPSGSRLGTFSIRNNTSGSWYDLNGLNPNDSNVACLAVSLLNSNNSLIGWIAITQIYASNNPPYSLPNVNLRIDGVQKTYGNFTNSEMPIVVAESASNTCNCQTEINNLQSQITSLQNRIQTLENNAINPTNYATKTELDTAINSAKDWVLEPDTVTAMGRALALGGIFATPELLSNYATTNQLFNGLNGLSSSIGGELATVATRVEVVADDVVLATDTIGDVATTTGKLSNALQVAGVITNVLTAVGTVALAFQVSSLTTQVNDFIDETDITIGELKAFDTTILENIEEYKVIETQHFNYLDANDRAIIGILTNTTNPKIGIIETVVNRTETKIDTISGSLVSIETKADTIINQTEKTALKTATCEAIDECALPQIDNQSANHRRILEDLLEQLAQRIIDNLITAYLSQSSGSFEIDYCGNGGTLPFSWSGTGYQGIANGIMQIGYALDALFCISNNGSSNSTCDTTTIRDKLNDLENKLDELPALLENGVDFHVTGFDEDLHTISGNYLAFRMIDFNAPTFPRRTSSTTSRPYRLYNPRIDISLEELRAITWNRGPVFCWVHPKGIKSRRKLFSGYFASYEDALQTLAQVYNLTNYRDSHIAVYGKSERTDSDVNPELITTKIVSATVYNMDLKQVMARWVSSDFEKTPQTP